MLREDVPVQGGEKGPDICCTAGVRPRSGSLGCAKGSWPLRGSAYAKARPKPLRGCRGAAGQCTALGAAGLGYAGPHDDPSHDRQAGDAGGPGGGWA